MNVFIISVVLAISFIVIALISIFLDLDHLLKLSIVCYLFSASIALVSALVCALSWLLRLLV